MYKPIEVNRSNLTIMGVSFPDLQTLENTAQGLGTNMFEGFEPTAELIQFYRDWRSGAIADSDFGTGMITPDELIGERMVGR